MLAVLTMAGFAGMPGSGWTLEAVDERSGLRVWLGSDTGSSRHDAKGVDQSWQADHRQTTVGISHSVTDALSVALSLARGSSDVDLAGQNSDNAHSKSWQGAVVWSPGEWSIRAALAMSDHETDLARVEIVPVRDTTLRLVRDARIDSSEQVADLGVSRSFDFANGWWVSPGLGVSHVRIKTDDYLEQIGTRTAFEVRTRDETESFAAATLGVGTLVFAGDWAILPSGELGVEYRLDGETPRSTPILAGRRYGYESEGFDAVRTRFSAGAGVGVRHWRGFGAHLRALHDRQSGHRGTWFGLDLEYDF